MRAYRVARFTAAIGGMALAIVSGTSEAIASTTPIDLVSGFREWMVTLILIAAISICTALVVERQERIIDLLNTRNAENDYTNIQRRIRANGNITTLYRDEE